MIHLSSSSWDSFRARMFSSVSPIHCIPPFLFSLHSIPPFLFDDSSMCLSYAVKLPAEEPMEDDEYEESISSTSNASSLRQGPNLKVRKTEGLSSLSGGEDMVYREIDRTKPPVHISRLSFWWGLSLSSKILLKFSSELYRMFFPASLCTVFLEFPSHLSFLMYSLSELWCFSGRKADTKTWEEALRGITDWEYR